LVASPSPSPSPAAVEEPPSPSSSPIVESPQPSSSPPDLVVSSSSPYPSSDSSSPLPGTAASNIWKSPSWRFPDLPGWFPSSRASPPVNTPPSNPSADEQPNKTPAAHQAQDANTNPAPAQSPPPPPSSVGVNNPQQLQQGLTNPASATAFATAISQAIASAGGGCNSGPGQVLAGGKLQFDTERTARALSKFINA
jgi:hypothetical protein